MELKTITMKEARQIKEALNRRTEEIINQKKINKLVEEGRIKADNQWLAEEVGFEWQYG